MTHDIPLVARGRRGKGIKTSRDRHKARAAAANAERSDLRPPLKDTDPQNSARSDEISALIQSQSHRRANFYAETSRWRFQ